MTRARISGFGLAIGLLLIILVACLLYVIMSPEKLDGWQIGGNSRIYDSSPGGDGTLYLISSKYMNGNDPDLALHAVSPNGLLKWKRPINEIYPAATAYLDQNEVGIVAADENGIYLEIVDSRPLFNESGIAIDSVANSYLVAVSSSGETRWTYRLPEGMYIVSFSSLIQALNHRVYVYSNRTEYVIDANGTLAWQVEGINRPPAVGPDGSVYVNKATYKRAPPEWNMSEENAYYWDCSDTFEAYDRDGKLLWQQNLTGYPISGSILLTFPAYHGGLVYVPLDNGALALDSNGNLAWVWQDKEQTNLYVDYNVPFDAEGNLYLKKTTDEITIFKRYYSYDNFVVSPTGKLVKTFQSDDSKNALARDGMIQYYTPELPEPKDTVIPKTVSSLGNLETLTIRAYSMEKGEDLWSVRLPRGNVTTVTVTPDNVMQLFPYRISSDIENMNFNNHNYENKYTPYHDVFNKTPATILSLREVSVLPSEEIIYVNLYTYAYETPTEYNESRCAYASTLYAISKNGTLLWQKPVDRNIYWMAAGNNSTIYYSTTDGRIFTTAMYVAGGLTVAAILYTIAHFLGAGTVARARSRLDANENRNAVCRYIAGNPGSTMRDISRGLGMNLGTIRYHLLILGLNHKIASYQADGKHMRYFVNSGAYTGEEQQIISIVRREGMRKVLECLLQQPGQSNKDLSAATGMRESAISRYTGELISAGLVEKIPAADGGTRYTIRAEPRDSVVNALGQVTGGNIAAEVEWKAPIAPKE